MGFAWPSRRVLLSLTGGAIVLVTAAWVHSVASEARYWQKTVGKPLESALGFRHGSPYVEEDGRSGAREVIAIESVVPGGAFHSAGFRGGDVVRGVAIAGDSQRFDGINGLFEALHAARGRAVTIRVVDGGDGQPIEARPMRALSIVVPPRPERK